MLPARVAWAPMKLLYKPFSMLAHGIASRSGRAAFRALWARIDEGEPPEPKLHEAQLGKVLAAAALEAATMAVAGALAERAAAVTFQYLFGIWPGEKRRED